MKILATILKEFRLLTRDPAGLAMIFLMPIVLVVVMALVQDGPFRDYQDVAMDVVFIDQDQDSVGIWIARSLSSAKNVHLITTLQGKTVTPQEATQLVNDGKYKAAIIVPPLSTQKLNKSVNNSVKQLLVNFGMGEPETNDTANFSAADIRLVFDPVTKANFKLAIQNSIEKIAANAQSMLLVYNLKKQLTELGMENKNQPVVFNNMLTVSEQELAHDALPVTNSVQHNVPAWTMFAMFLILFPLAGNLIKEREEGSLLRLRLISGSEFPVIAGKYSFYFAICMMQFGAMLLVGIYLLPTLGLPRLSLGNNHIGLLLTATAVSLAATAYGLLVGVFFKTYHQALTFGSVSVVLLAALGGVWVPTYVMPEILQHISQLSPMSWGLEACNDLFLRNADTAKILPQLYKLTGFALVLLALSFGLYKSRTRE